MSHLAVHDVTRGWQALLHSELARQSGSSVVVTLLPPGEELPQKLGINLYLYRVVESPATRNRDWPGDRRTPPTDRPALGLHLYYLLTPLGTKPEESGLVGDDAHTMLGLAMLTLYEHPVLNNVHLPGFDADIELPPYLLDSYEKIKIILTPTGLEDLSKIWATINKPYRLSVAYEVSLVELTPTPPPPVRGGIVTFTNVDVRTLDPAHLLQLVPASGALVRIAGGQVTANTLRLEGTGLIIRGQTSLVRVGGQPVTISSTPAPTETALTVLLPLSLDAGPDADVTVQRMGRTSAPLTFHVRPWLSFVSPIRTALDPALTADGKLELTGFGFTATPREVRFDALGSSTSTNAFDAGGTDTQATVTIPAGLANGLYEVRLVLNDADRNATNARTLEVLPLVADVTTVVVPLSSPPVPGDDGHELTIQGARMNGASVRLLIDGAEYVVGANLAPAQIIYRLGRLLAPGVHTVAVNVDGHTSRTVDLVV